jgi:uncharacterized protein YlaI
MDLDDQIELEHLLFFDRKCRVCGKVKSLMDDFYLTRKNKSTFTSAYSYECKECTVKRITETRRLKINSFKWEYPDW